MVDRTRELELSLGDGVKRIEDDELETVIIQRALRTKHDITADTVLTDDHLEACGLARKMYHPIVRPMSGKKISGYTRRRLHPLDRPDLAIVIPAFNEAATITGL